jgi:hypothetical protein
MGIERTVTLWYLHRQLLLHELAALETRLVQVYAASYAEVARPEARKGVGPFPAEWVELEEQYKRTQEMLRNLGPCPRPMMG